MSTTDDTCYDYYVYYWQEYCLPYHSHDYCSGYWHSYNYERNNIAQQQNQQSDQQSNQQINIYNYGNGNIFNTGFVGTIYSTGLYGNARGWTIQESNTTGTLINIATFISPTGPDSNPTATVAIYMDRLDNSTTNLNNYAHFVAFTDYENNTNFHAFKLLELSTNSSILAGKPAYTIIGTYKLHSSGLQKLMEVGTIIGDKAYSVQYIADAPSNSRGLLFRRASPPIGTQ
jgi:hypothetical protein